MLRAFHAMPRCARGSTLVIAAMPRATICSPPKDALAWGRRGGEPAVNRHSGLTPSYSPARLDFMSASWCGATELSDGHVVRVLRNAGLHRALSLNMMLGGQLSAA